MVSISQIWSTSNHAYGEIMKALYKRAVTGEGSRIDVADPIRRFLAVCGHYHAPDILGSPCTAGAIPTSSSRP